MSSTGKKDDAGKKDDESKGSAKKRGPGDSKGAPSIMAGGEAKAPSRKRRRRRSTDPDLPKQPLSAYNIFFREERLNWLREKEENPDQGQVEEAADAPRHGSSIFREMGKVLGSRWKALTPSARSRYDELAKKEQERYRRELAIHRERKQKPAPVELAATSGSMGDVVARPQARYQQQPPPQQQLQDWQGSSRVVGMLPHSNVASASQERSRRAREEEQLHAFRDVNARPPRERDASTTLQGMSNDPQGFHGFLSSIAARRDALQAAVPARLQDPWFLGGQDNATAMLQEQLRQNGFSSTLGSVLPPPHFDATSASLYPAGLYAGAAAATATTAAQPQFPADLAMLLGSNTLSSFMNTSRTGTESLPFSTSTTGESRGDSGSRGQQQQGFFMDPTTSFFDQGTVTPSLAQRLSLSGFLPASVANTGINPLQGNTHHMGIAPSVNAASAPSNDSLPSSLRGSMGHNDEETLAQTMRNQNVSQERASSDQTEMLRLLQQMIAQSSQQQQQGEGSGQMHPSDPNNRHFQGGGRGGQL